MKFMCIVLSLFAFASAQAKEIDSKKISDIVDTLAKFTYSIDEEKMEGATIDEMFENFCKSTDTEECTVVNFPADKDLPEVDGGTDNVGLMRTRQAINMFIGYFRADGEPTEKQETAIKNMFNGLSKAGAKFGYSPYGSSICGVTYPEVIIIDVKKKKFYRVNFVGGSC